MKYLNRFLSHGKMMLATTILRQSIVIHYTSLQHQLKIVFHLKHVSLSIVKSCVGMQNKYYLEDICR